MANSQTFKIQYYGEDRRWHFATDGDHRIEVSSKRAAIKERDLAEIRYGRKARILQIVVRE